MGQSDAVCATEPGKDGEKGEGDNVVKQLSTSSRCNGDLHLRIHDGVRGIRLGEVFRGFIQLIGPQLCGLELKHCHFLSRNCDAIQTIGASCVNLKSLVLQGCNLPDDSANQLVGVLRGNFGRNLTSLDLSGSSHMSRAVGGISDVLRQPNSLPALRALRLTVKDTPTLTSIYDFLRARAKLVVLELGYQRVPLVPTPNWSNDFDNITRDNFLAEYQKYLTVGNSRLTLAHKLAFISLVTSADRAGTRSALCRLDVEMIALIFKFAKRQIQIKLVK